MSEKNASSTDGDANRSSSEITRDVENVPISQAKPEEASPDPNIVDWEGPDDPENPQNW